MGYFLPRTLGRGDGVPTKELCKEELFGAMVERCVVKEKGKMGMRNVKVLPGRGSTGQAFVQGRGMFLMGAEVVE